MMVHVGNRVQLPDGAPEGQYLQRLDLLSGQMVWFTKHDIINADTQMQSLIDAGIDMVYGHFFGTKIHSIIMGFLPKDPEDFEGKRDRLDSCPLGFHYGLDNHLGSPKTCCDIVLWE